MAVAIYTSFIQHTSDAGAVLSGGSITVYAAGTTTPLSLYSDTALSASASNPVTLDSGGRHAMRYIAAAAYKVLVKNSAGTTIRTLDNIDPGVPIGSGTLAIANGGTASATAAAAVAALGAATAAEVADIAADVASLVGATASSEKTHIATGTTGQRPASPAEGDFRRNTTTTRWEGYVAAWQQFLTDNEIASSAEGLAGTDNTKVMTPLRVRGASAFQSLLLHVRDVKAAGTDGGTFTSGAWQTRTLQTSSTNEITGASLGSNQITLPSGTYYIEASAPGVYCGKHQTRLRNTTDGSTTIVGTTERTDTAGAVPSASRSFVSGRFTIAAQKVFELQHKCSDTRSTDGMGSAMNGGESELYADVKIWKVG